MRAVDSHERLGAAVGEGLKIASLIGDQAEVFPLGINRPGIDVGGAVFDRELRRVIDSGVVPDFDAGVVPPVEAMTRVAAVVERDVLFQARLAGAHVEERLEGLGQTPPIAHGEDRARDQEKEGEGEDGRQLCEMGKLNSSPKADHAPR